MAPATFKTIPTLATLLALSLAAPALANAPTTMAVSGVVRATGGGPVADGDYMMVFAIYDAVKGGKKVWDEPAAKVPIASGQFMHTLGSTKPLSAAAFAQLSPGWLSLTIGVHPELPRTPLSSVAWALNADIAAKLACSGCVGPEQLAAGAIAGKHIAAGTVTADKVGFTFAGSKTKGGPADKALDLQCTGCVSLQALKIDGDLDLSGNGLKAKKVTAVEIAAGTVAAGTFVGDGSKLTGLKVPAGQCPKGEVVVGIAPDGKLSCAVPQSAKLPPDALDDVSNDLLSNEFLWKYESAKTPVPIPDNNPTGVADEITVPDVGLAKDLKVHVKVSNSNLAEVEITLFGPDNTPYILVAVGTAKGKLLQATFPSPDKPSKGDLSTWVGKNPKGKWRLKVADKKFLNNKNDGAIEAWSVDVLSVSKSQVQAKGDVLAKKGLIAQGTFRYPVATKEPFSCTADKIGFAWVHPTEQTLRICNGKNWAVLNLSVWGTEQQPALSCLDLLKKMPSTVSGDYWIKPAKVAKAFKVYCDMKTEGGGYTFYPVAAGIKTSRSTDNNSCKALGMDIVYPRSKAHFAVMLSKYGTSYFATIPGVSKPGNGGNYTGCIMRSPAAYGSGCKDWRVPDGGRWWLRDKTYSEPNGDYTANCWLSMYKYDVNDIQFNDGNCTNVTSKYICSTNDKP